MQPSKKGQVAALKGDKASKHSAVTLTGTTTATASATEVRRKANSANHSKPEHPWNKIVHGIQTAVGTCGLYMDTMEFALEHLHEEGVESASLFDAKTGEVTEKGYDTITAAVENGWAKSISLAEDGYGDVAEKLGKLLSDRSVFDYVKADLEGRGCLQKPQAKTQATATANN